MRLFYSPTSPYARKARVLILEKGLGSAVALVAVDAMGADAAAIQAANPLGKIPALLLDDGRTIYDSPVICAFLDAMGDGPRLLPAAADAAIETRVREALADGIMDAAFALVMERRRPEPQRSPEWMARWAGQIRRAAAAARPTTGFDMGDLALACALGYLDFRLGDLDWRASASPALFAWQAEAGQRPSLLATAPPAA